MFTGDRADGENCERTDENLAGHGGLKVSHFNICSNIAEAKEEVVKLRAGGRALR
jgi:hypothetical protein